MTIQEYIELQSLSDRAFSHIKTYLQESSKEDIEKLNLGDSMIGDFLNGRVGNISSYDLIRI